MKALKRMVAFLLALIIIIVSGLTPDLIVIADSVKTNPNSNGPGKNKITGGAYKAPGVLVSIRKIKNSNKKNTEKTAIDDAIKTAGYYDKKDPAYTDGILITLDSESRSYTSEDNYYMSNTGATTKLSKVYSIQRTLSPQDYKQVGLATQLLKKDSWGNGTMSVSEWKEVKDKITGDYKDAMKSFVKMFPTINKLSNTWRSSLAQKGDGSKEKSAVYADMIYTISKAGGLGDEYIKEYVQNQNDPTRSDYYIVISATVVIAQGKGGKIYWQNFADWMSNQTGKSRTNYIQLKSHAKSYTDDKSGFADTDATFYKASDVESNRCRYLWLDAGSGKWSARYMLMPQWHGEQKGGGGYTYMGYGRFDLASLPQAQVRLTAEPNKIKSVNAGIEETAKITISLQQDKAKDIDYYTTLTTVFKQQEKLGHKATLTLNLTGKTDEGDGKSTYYFDDVIEGLSNKKKQFTMKKNSGTSVIKLTGLTLSKFKDYMSGKKVFVLEDQKINLKTPNTKTKNTYYVSGSLSWGNGVTCELTPAGKKKDGKKAYDSAQWQTKKDLAYRFDVYLEATPNKVQKKGDEATATIKVNLKTSKKNRTTVENKYKLQESTKTKLPTLTFKFTRKYKTGDAKSDKICDELLTSGLTYKDDTIVIKNLSLADCKKWLDGTNTIEFNDTKMYPTKQSKNQYEVTASLVWGKEKEVLAYGKGKSEECKGKQAAWDYAAWGAVADGADKTVGDIHLQATTDTPNVDKGASVKADVEVSLKQASDNLSKINQLFDSNGKANLVLQFGCDYLDGTGESTILFDTVKPTGLLVDDEDTLTIKNITKSQFDSYASGSKTIKLTDTGITINEWTSNLYKVSGQLEWSNGKTVIFYATGKAEDCIGTETAYDVVEWETPDSPEEPEEPEEATYYSSLREPYAEIKEGAPGNEHFEAMAGVPTTEDLYVGFGAQEFSLNMETSKHENPQASRTYTFTYTTSQCIDKDEKCKVSCTGHSVTKSCGAKIVTQAAYTDSQGNYHPEVSHTCSGATATAKYGETNSVTCECGAVTAVANGTALCPDDKGGCTWHDGQHGCKCSHTCNQSHPRSVTWTATVTQPIAAFPYLAIDNMELWQLTNCKLEGNPELFSNPNVNIDPNTGYKVFSGNNDYTSGNGRLKFSLNYGSSDMYGDAKASMTNSQKLKYVDCDKQATGWFNSLINGKSVDATTVSDYCIMQTSQGYQTAAYHTYKSDTVPLTNEQFTEGGESKSIHGNLITYTEKPTWEDLWKDNPYTASDWSEEDLVRSGYTGEFSNPSFKWSNNNKHLNYADPTFNLINHPYTDYKAGSTAFGVGFGDTRLTQTGLNIIDSTNAHGEWSKDDGIEPVSNGVWDTGKTSLTMQKVAQHGSTSGPDIGDGSDSVDMEVSYSPAHTEVNDIVIHNPVSSQYATVIPNDKKYDLRTTEALEQASNEAEFLKDDGKCPRDGTCEFCTLTCTEEPQPHNESCYSYVMEDDVVHVGGLNTHVCNERCTTSSAALPDTTGFKHWLDSYLDPDTKQVIRNKVAYCTGKNCPYCEASSFSDIIYLVDPESGVITPTSMGAFKAKYLGVKWYHDDEDDYCSSKYQVHTSYSVSKCTQCDLHCGFPLTESVRRGEGSQARYVVDYVYVNEPKCTHELNTHVCTDACTTQKRKQVLVCDNPHHYEPGEDWDYNDPNNHYDFGDSRCWSPCCDDSKHKNNGIVNTVDGKVVEPSELFINLDREFKIYYPSTGDFAENPTLHGIANVTSTRGMGYTDNMDTTKWTRNKFVKFPVNVIDSTGKSHNANEFIDLKLIPEESGGYYTFYCTLNNSEVAKGITQFLPIANNATEEEFVDENEENTNRIRLEANFNAMHTAKKTQYIDVVGYIGSLTINDTGDFRFATLFKQKDPNGGWLIDNLVPNVNYKLPNKVVSDKLDIRQEQASESTQWHSSYGITKNETGGKAYEHLPLPLTPALNPIKALRKQAMRPGYKLYMDVETAGNYYGENYDGNTARDADLVYKMQITPRYWALNLTTGEYTPVDVYMSSKGSYCPVTKFNNPTDSDMSEWLYYLDWLEESARRNYTTKEKEASNSVKNNYSQSGSAYTLEGSMFDSINMKIRLPVTKPVVQGSANRLFLNDLSRTFIGSSKTYGVDKNPDRLWKEADFARQSQRWHFTLGLPSSSVFVKADEPCNDTNINAIKEGNYAIVCALNIKVRGSVWTLKYDGIATNNGFQIIPDGKTYTAPIDPDTQQPTKDPIITIYSNKFTSKDDLRTEGTH